MKPVACWLYDNVMEGGIDRLGQVSGPCVSSAWGEGIFLSLRNAVIFHCLMSVFHFPMLVFRGPMSVISCPVADFHCPMFILVGNL